jgi:hypothetical protein
MALHQEELEARLDCVFVSDCSEDSTNMFIVGEYELTDGILS